MNLKEDIKDKMDPALILSPRWQKEKKTFVTPIKPKDGYVTKKDLAQLQNVKDMLFGGINVDKHESNIIKNSLVGVKNYRDFKPEECKVRMKSHHRYANGIHAVK
jgi:hypothetical protein